MSLGPNIPSLMGTVLQNVETDYIDRILLDEHGRLRALFAASVFAALPPGHLRVWCHQRARYGLPTMELVQWLRDRIAGREVIEIGSGNGDLGYLAGIRETDSYIQQTPELRLYYGLTGQPPTNPPATVRKIDALQAIAKFKPRVVVASWFTRKFEAGQDREGEAQANIYGVREEEIVAQVETYIHIGQESVHAQKTIRALPHETIKLSGLLSRTADQGTNMIQVWERPL